MTKMNQLYLASDDIPIGNLWFQISCQLAVAESCVVGAQLVDDLAVILDACWKE